MQRYYEMLKDTWRSLGYRKAIATLKRQDHKIKFANEAREYAISPILPEIRAHRIGSRELAIE